MKVKICGLTRLEDAEAALELGADALGFILEPTSPRCLTIEQLSIPVRLGPFALTFAVYGPCAKEIPKQFAAYQFESGIHPEGETRRSLKVIRFNSQDSIESILAKFEGLDWVAIEAKSDQGYGGVGAKLDWGQAAEVVAAAKIPVVLAGGLNPENVAEAVKKVKPYAVDVASGIESAKGIKDFGKMKRFIFEAKNSG